MPLLHFSGIHGNNQSFSIAFCFIHEDSLPYHSWSLQTLNSLFKLLEIPPPPVFITNKDPHLITSIKKTFPNSTHLLSQWHIQKDITATASPLLNDKKKLDEFIKNWSDLIERPDPSQFPSVYESLIKRHFPRSLIEHINSTWISFVTKFCNPWTKKITHFDHQSTTRVDLSHPYIKSLLLKVPCDYSSMISSLSDSILLEQEEIRAEFNQEEVKTLRNINSIFKNRFGKISHFALKKAQLNFNQRSDLEYSVFTGCHSTRTGIPCKHRLAKLDGKGAYKVDPKEFHIQWHYKVRFFSFLFHPFFPFLSSFSPFPPSLPISITKIIWIEFRVKKKITQKNQKVCCISNFLSICMLKGVDLLILGV
jgi:hypothetical protein